MSEIKRGQVPWKRSVATQNAELRPTAAEAKVAAAKRRERPLLDPSNAVAFRGNLMTGEALDARKDLPPQGHNPPPREARAKRRAALAKTYARPAVTRHPSAKDPFARLRAPETQRSAILQRLVNSNELVRSGFERAVGAKLIRDGRTDGVFTLAETPPGEIGVSKGAMNSGITPESFYDMLAAMDAAVMRQAAELAALQAQKGAGGADGPTSGSFLGMPFGPGLPMFDAWGGEDAMSGLGASLGGLASNVTGVTSGSGNSVDVATQKVSLAVQRMNQMYSLIGTMYSKYNESGGQAVNNIK